jgi:hypothetical protein
MRCCPGHLPVERTLFVRHPSGPRAGASTVSIGVLGHSGTGATTVAGRPGSGTRLRRLVPVGREAFDLVGGLVRLGHQGVI